MALRNQPYFPLYVQDFLTDEKLNSCSASSQGVYIKIMCILHKQETYGEILLKQKDKQKSSIISNFALKLSKLLPFDEKTILESLNELIEENVLIIEDEKLYQKRMVKDGAISFMRSNIGKKGGGNPILNKQTDKDLFKQKDKQNTEYENENENENIIEIKNESIIYLMQKVFSDSGLIFTGSNLIDFREIAERILNLKDIAQATDIQKDELINVWTEIVQYCKNNSQFYGSVPAINKHLDKIINSIKHKPTKKGAVKREYYAEDFK